MSDKEHSGPNQESDEDWDQQGKANSLLMYPLALVLGILIGWLMTNHGANRIIGIISEKFISCLR